MNGPSERAVEAALGALRADERIVMPNEAIAQTTVDAAYPVVRADLAKDPEFLAMVCGRAVEDLREEVAREIAEALRSWAETCPPTHSPVGAFQAADFIEREFIARPEDES